MNQTETDAIMSNAQKMIESCHTTLRESQEIRRKSSAAIELTMNILNFYEFQFDIDTSLADVDEEIKDSIESEKMKTITSSSSSSSLLSCKCNPITNGSNKNGDLCCQDKVKKDVRFERADAKTESKSLIVDLNLNSTKPAAPPKRSANGKCRDTKKLVNGKKIPSKK